jgi:hypothetical protein
MPKIVPDFSDVTSRQFAGRGPSLSNNGRVSFTGVVAMLAFDSDGALGADSTRTTSPFSGTSSSIMTLVSPLYLQRLFCFLLGDIALSKTFFFYTELAPFAVRGRAATYHRAEGFLRAWSRS